MKWAVVASRVAVAAAVFLFAGCDDDDGSSAPPDPGIGVFQFGHAIADAPALALYAAGFDDTVGATNEGELTLVGGIDFGGVTQFGTAAPGSFRMEVRYIDPETANEAVLIPEFLLGIGDEMIHTVIARGSFAAPDPMILSKPAGEVDSAESADIEVQFVHLGTNQTLDIYFGDNDQDIASAAPFATLTPGNWTEPTLLPEGEFRLRLTAAGNTNAIYDSGEFTITRRSRRTIILADSFGPDPTAKDSFQFAETGGLAFPNEVAQAGYRVINGVGEETDITVDIIDGATDEIIDTMTVDFGQITDFMTIDPVFIDVSVSVASDPGVQEATASFSLNQDTFYTIVIGGSVVRSSVGIGSISASRRPLAIGANAQFINTLPRTEDDVLQPVDFYALDAGDALADGSPRASFVGFLNGSTTTLPAAPLDIVVTASGTESIHAGPERLNVDAGANVLTIIAEAAGGGTPYQIIIDQQ